MKSFFSFYKWHLIFLLLIIVCSLFVFNSISSSTPADLRIAYSSKNYINTATFNDYKSEIEMLLREATGDDKLVAEVESFSDKDESNILNKLKEYIKSDNYDIYIADKKAFEAIEDKSVFIDTSVFLSQTVKEKDMLEDSDGRFYAVSLEENSLMELLGVTEDEDLYIAAAAETADDTSAFRKNGSNICGYIIESKTKYIY